MALKLSSAVAGAIRDHGERGYPHEVCGLLLGRFGAGDERVAEEHFELENERVDSRHNRYEVSGASMLRAPLMRA